MNVKLVYIKGNLNKKVMPYEKKLLSFIYRQLLKNNFEYSATFMTN